MRARQGVPNAGVLRLRVGLFHAQYSSMAHILLGTAVNSGRGNESQEATVPRRREEHARPVKYCNPIVPSEGGKSNHA